MVESIFLNEIKYIKYYNLKMLISRFKIKIEKITSQPQENVNLEIVLFYNV